MPKFYTTPIQLVYLVKHTSLFLPSIKNWRSVGKYWNYGVIISFYRHALEFLCHFFLMKIFWFVKKLLNCHQKCAKEEKIISLFFANNSKFWNEKSLTFTSFKSHHFTSRPKAQNRMKVGCQKLAAQLTHCTPILFASL